MEILSYNADLNGVLGIRFKSDCSGYIENTFKVEIIFSLVISIASD